MTKSKHFAFAVAIVVAILLVVGNWTTPVQANRGNIVTATPTGTPLTDPDSQGEPVSLEQQEELKAVIQAYFEIRYNALSILQPYGFRLDSFGDLVSDGVDAKAFLDAELGKLALEVKYAELNRSRYVDYKYFLDFSNFSMDAATQLVTVSVVEDNEIISENSAEGNPVNPLVAQMRGLKHTIVLRQEQDQWKIVSDHYNDFLWRTMRQTGESVEETLNMLNTMEAPQVTGPSGESAGAEATSLLPDDSSSHAYDRAGAAYYAINHAFPEDYNQDYPSYDDGNNGDCTNFVSQALYVGGNVSMSIPDPLPPPDPILAYSGWYLLNDMQRATAWNEVNFFYTLVVTPGEQAANTEGPEGSEFPTVPEGQFPAGLMLGDVIQYERHGDTIWDHAAIVVGFDPNNGDPLVASHSPNNPAVNFKDVVAHVKTRFIHIERSDGNPPVKVQTISAADDAGGNPGGCTVTNSDPGLNYLGGCFNGNSNGVTSGFLFRNIQIPKNAQIKYAYVTFTTDGTYGVIPNTPGEVYAPIALQIFGENTATPANFSSTNTPADRGNLTASVPWPVNRTDTAINIAYDTWHWKGQRTTPAITSIIQAITGLNGWSSGNTLSLIFQDGRLPGAIYARRVIAYEASTAVNENYSPARLIAAYDMVTTSFPFPSLAAQDGWILETSETSNKGNNTNSGSTTFLVGDDSADRQYRSILHFNTAPNLPDNAVITYVVLKIKQQSITGTDHFTTLGNLAVDIKKPAFGTNANLAKSDFEDAAGLPLVSNFDPIPSADNWYTAVLSSASFPYINLTGTTQLRLSFTTDDNDDLNPDYISFFSGNDTTAANRPQLIVYYYVPAP